MSDCANAPHSKTPERLSASTKKRIASSVTTSGDCIWNPHPSCVPPERNASISPASTRNDSTTPAEKTTPCSRIAFASPCACSTKPITLMPSTGKTQGMRFSSKPPINANASAASALPPIEAACEPAPEEIAPAAAAIACDTGASTLIALRPSVPGHPPSATATPFTDRTPGGTGSASFISMRTPLPSRVTFCGAAGSISPSRSGKNTGFAGTPTPAGGTRRTTSALPCNAESNFHPDTSTGSWLRARSIGTCERVLRGASAADTGRTMSSSPFSGMQMSLHTSHSAFALSGTLPGFAPAGGVISESSTTSSS